MSGGCLQKFKIFFFFLNPTQIIHSCDTNIVTKYATHILIKAKYRNIRFCVCIFARSAYFYSSPLLLRVQSAVLVIHTRVCVCVGVAGGHVY